LKGKLAYMSPEQACGKPIDRRSDVFSLGIVLYELLTGRRLFKGDSDLSTLEQVRTAVIEPPTRFDAEIPAVLEAAVLKALAREANQRYQTAAEFQAALERIMAESGQGFSSLHLSQLMATTFAEEMRNDAERLQSAHQETVRLSAAPARTAVAASPASPRRHDTPRPVTRPARHVPPRPSGHPWRTAALGAGLVFLLGASMVVAAPSILQWARTQPADVQRIGTQIEAKLASVGFGHLLPPSPRPVVQRGKILEVIEPPAEPEAIVPPAVEPSPMPVEGTPVVSVMSESPMAVPAVSPPSPPHPGPGREEVQHLLRQAKALYAEGRLDAVEDVLRTVIERDPHSPLAFHLLGTVFLERKDEERAFEIFSQAVHQFPDNATLRYDLGFLYAQRGVGSLARDELSRALALQPNGGPAARARFLLREGMGRPGGAPVPPRPPHGGPRRVEVPSGDADMPTQGTEIPGEIPVDAEHAVPEVPSGETP
ncbi:MAG: tetratricopeptide repeat protein, partial [Nitrospiria bacterium]